MTAKPRGRPRKYAAYDMLVSSLPRTMAKRPKYHSGIGVFRGSKVETVWIKIRLPHGGAYKGRSYSKGASLEIKLGNLSSWSWQALEAKRDELQGKADRQEPLEQDAPPLFAEHATNWLSRLKRRTRGYRTAEIHLNAHLLKRFGSKALDALRVQDFNTYISDRLLTAKPSTVVREVNTLNSILNDAVKSGLLESNPGQHADKIKGVVPRQRFLDLEETLRLLQEAEKLGQWLSDFILWCLHSGMRRGEVLALRWSGIRKLPNGRQIVQVDSGKSDRPRSITCTETMIEILGRQRGRKIEDRDQVFPIARITLRRKWESARINANLTDVTIHDLRRTHSTQAAVAGVDLRTLAGRLGHANLSMLEKHYAAIVGSASENAAARIEQAFSQKV